MATVEIPKTVLDKALANQVAAYDERFQQGQHAAAAAQTAAFGKRDATGVESVHDIMPTERENFERLVMAAGQCHQKADPSAPQPVLVLDFGCGDGRYVMQYLQTSRALRQRFSCDLHVLNYDISSEALQCYHNRALAEGLKAATENGPLQSTLSPLSVDSLSLEFALGAPDADTHAVEAQLRATVSVFDVVLIGWGTLSSIPRLAGINPESLLSTFARMGRSVMNVASSTNNHVKFQREFAARRQAFMETDNQQLRAWLQPRIGLATFPRSYYYPVGTGLRNFYAAITAEEEVARLRSCGFSSVQLRLCNVINFFTILTQPRAAKINAAVITLLEKGDAWGAQLLLCRLIARAFRKPLAAMRSQSCVFDQSSQFSLLGQVARYFISTGISQLLQAETDESAGMQHGSAKRHKTIDSSTSPV